MHITMLEVDDQPMVDPHELREHVTSYYKQLFGSAEVANMQLDPDLWSDDQKISLEDNEFLTRPFSLEELDLTMKDMKNNIAPGPDGFSVEFFKAFWPLIRDDVKAMLDKLHEGSLELWSGDLTAQSQTNLEHQAV
jgi:hypothetical protein